MIKDKILVLKEDVSITNNLKFDANTEFHIVMDVVYMQGYPLAPSFQPMMMNWLTNNDSLFKEIFRQ